jgi:predicted transcriptional regulator
MTTKKPNLNAPMAATSLKLPEDLKRRIERLASAANKTPHAFMVDALAREAERSELRARFADEAAISEEEAFSSGKSFELAATFDYLTARASGAKARRPKARAWRRSK